MDNGAEEYEISNTIDDVTLTIEVASSAVRLEMDGPDMDPRDMVIPIRLFETVVARFPGARTEWEQEAMEIISTVGEELRESAVTPKSISEWARDGLESARHDLKTAKDSRGRIRKSNQASTAYGQMHVYKRLLSLLGCDVPDRGDDG